MRADTAITEDPKPLSPRSRFQAAMILAMAADALSDFCVSVIRRRRFVPR
jgi:hypothetical protein